MQTLNIPLYRPEERNEPGGMERNVFRLSRRPAERRGEERGPSPDLVWLEREFSQSENDAENRNNRWQSYNAAAHNIRTASALAQAAANHVAETALILTLVRTMLDEASESDSQARRDALSARIGDALGNIDSSFGRLAQAMERTSAVYVNGGDSFMAQVGVGASNTRQIVINQVNTRTLGLGDGSGNISTGTFEELRDNVEAAAAAIGTERALANGAIIALGSERAALDVNQRGGGELQPGTINPPLGDGATPEERMRRAEAERAMRMAQLRREAGSMKTLFGMIELFRT